MTRARTEANLCKWLVISIVAHAALLLVPIQIFEAVFPRDRVESYGLPRDLTPDFSEVAIGVVQVPEVADVEVADGPLEDIDEILFPRTASPGLSSMDSPSEGRLPGIPHYFPARPRLLVPPPLDDLDITDLRVSISILVGPDGLPQQVIIPDSLSDREIGRRLVESAWRFRFEPARRGDLPVASWIDLPLVLESSRKR